MEERVILVIDESDAWYQLFKRKLEPNGYSLAYAPYWRDGIRVAYDRHPDIVIMDSGFADTSVIEVCQRIRDMSDILIILMLQNNETEAVDVYRPFADEVLLKPFLVEDLEIIIRDLLKKKSNRSRPSIDLFEDDHISIDLLGRKVSKRGEALNLTATEYQLLQYLVRNRGRTVGQTELISRVWGTDYLASKKGSSRGTLQVYIAYLRSKLEDDPSNPKYILTKWGVGYWFADEINREVS